METNSSPSIKDETAILHQNASRSQPVRYWFPAAGDELTGTIAGLTPAIGRFGKGHRLLIRDPGGVTWSLWLTRFLKESLHSCGAKAGDMISIQCLGKGTSRRGTRFNRYNCIVKQEV